MRSILFSRIRGVSGGQGAAGQVIPAPVIAALVSGSAIAVTIADNTGGVGQTILQRSTNGVVFTAVTTLPAGVTAYIDSGLSAGVPYYYRAVSVIGTAQSDPSNVVTRTINAPTPGGAIADGDWVTVQIPGAGSNVPASNQAFTGGHDGMVATATLGARLEGNLSGNWAQPGADGPYVNADRTLNGPVALRNACDFPYLGAYQHGLRYDTGAEREVMVCRYSYYFENPNNSGLEQPDRGQLKQARFVGAINHNGGLNDAEVANIYITWGANGHQVSINNSAGNTAISSSYDSGRFGYWHNQGEWLTNEIRVIRNSAPDVADGSIRVVTRRALTGEIVGIREASNRIWTPGDPFLRYFVLQMYMGNGFDLAVKTYIDRDIYVSWSDSRTQVPKFIMLGNAANYADCTTFTECLWSDWEDLGGTTSIRLKVNQGRHESTAGLYAYAFSDAGVVINTAGVALPSPIIVNPDPVLLFSNDFSVNTGGIVDSHSGFQRFSRVTNAPYWGTTHSVRVNLKNTVTDPITLKQGDSLRTMDLDPTVVVADFDPAQHAALTWVLPFRLDDALWGDQTDAKMWEGKLVYIGHKGASTEQGFYLAGGMGGLRGNLNIGDNWLGSDSPWDGWENRSYGWRSGATPTTVTYARTDMPWGTDGQWHELRIQFDFVSNPQCTRARVLVDGFPLRGAGASHTANFDENGWFNLPPEFVPSVIRLGYGDATSANASTNRAGLIETGIAAGLQWARPQLWSGLKQCPWLPSARPARVNLPVSQWWVGDSQINGRANGICKSNQTAHTALWPQYYVEAPIVTQDRIVAIGGRGMLGHMNALQGAWGTSSTQRSGPEWVHLVETGGQNNDGQRTPRQYGDTFVAFMRWINQKSPNCIISIETPFSFGSEFDPAMDRDWTDYRIELLARIEQLAAEGIVVHMVDNDARIRALERLLTPAQVWYQSDHIAWRHFTEVGNLMTALAIYWHLGHDISALNFAAILAEGLVSQAQLNAILQVINAPYP